MSLPRVSRDAGADPEKAVKGGVAAWWKRGRRTISEVDGIPKEELTNGEAADYIAVVVEFNTVPLLIMLGYLNTYDGFGGANIRMMQIWAGITEATSTPYVIIADWNGEPCELAHGIRVNQIKANIICPTSVDYTCDNDAQRMIVYVLADNGSHYILQSVEADRGLPAGHISAPG